MPEAFVRLCYTTHSSRCPAIFPDGHASPTYLSAAGPCCARGVARTRAGRARAARRSIPWSSPRRERAERSFDVPASIDVIDGATIRDGQPAINLSEPLVRVPGVFAANRSNYAQDLQISSRGFGGGRRSACAAFVSTRTSSRPRCRTVRARPAASACCRRSSIEVLRGPFSTLYGNASGGVISVFTEDPTRGPGRRFRAQPRAATRRTTSGLKATGTAGGVGYVDRRQPLRDRRLSRALGGDARHRQREARLRRRRRDTRVTVIGSSQHQPDSQDPLGLTQAQVDADPRQADPVTAALQHAQDRQPAAGRRCRRARDCRGRRRCASRATAGARQIGQYLALSGAALTSSGGVVNLDRDYGGLGARLIFQGELAGAPLTFLDRCRRRSACASSARDSSTTTASQGALRRDEDDTVTSGDVYAELAMACAAGAVAHARRALEPRAATTPTIITSSDRIPTTAARARTTTRARSRRSSGTRGRPQRLRELRAGLRDADVRRTRV